MYHKILNENNEVIGISGPDPLDLEYDENWVAITEEEFNELNENLSQQDEKLTLLEPTQEDSQRPTYEELEEENARLWYQILTGEEFEW